jgi:radical SAM protein with 4Fe4S-binding SPASM domain
MKFNFFTADRALVMPGTLSGCTGYGCGAAFNFISVLSDGETHACRKFPSPIGNVFKQNLKEIYDSPQAERYRSGPEQCRTCDLWIVCRGCLASAFSEGLDVFKDRDPYCFADSHKTESS